MPTTKPRRRDLPENRRACILKAARGVFARQGYADTVVEDIAEHAGIAKGTLYLYFKSKEDIFLATLIDDARRLQLLTREAIEAASSWEDKLKAYVDVRLDYLEAHQDFVRIFLAEFRSMMVRGARMHPELFHAIRESEDHLAQVFASAVARQEIRPVDPQLAAATLSELTRGIIERRLLGWSCCTRALEADFVLDLLCRGLAVDAVHPTEGGLQPAQGFSPAKPTS